MKYLSSNSIALRKISGVFALALLLPLTCAFGQGTWTQKPDMPFYRNHNTGLAYNGKIYLFGGGADLTSCTNLVHEYDPETGSFTAKASMPVGLCGAAVVEFGGKIYLFGGYTAFAGEVSDAALEYDVANNTWKTLPPMLIALGYASAVAFSSQGRIWVVGGGNAFGLAGLNEVEIYDKGTNTWSFGPPMPSGRGGLTAHPLAENWGFMIFGGSANTVVPAEDTVLLYEFFGGAWYVKKAAPTRRTLHGSALIGGEVFLSGKVFLMGGMNPGEPVFSTVDMYDIYTDEWTSAVAPMLTARRAFVAAAVDKKIYVFGGNNESGVLKSVEVFDPGNLVTAPEPIAMTTQVSTFPNPATERIFFRFEQAVSGTLTFSRPDGTVIITEILNREQYLEISVAGLPVGVYYWKWAGSDRAHGYTGKVLVAH